MTVVAIVVIYKFGIDDSVILWIFANYLLLMDQWPKLMASMGIKMDTEEDEDDEKEGFLKRTFGKVKRLVVPRFLRAQGEKTKTE